LPARCQARGERVATVAFKHGAKAPAIEQIRGPCNKAVPGIKKVISRWLRTQRKQNEHEVEIADNDLPPADASE
jgi:hypothetical protein